MPRDGSHIYARPPGTDGIPDTTIESTKYNAYVADVEQDLNLPRPIIAGGTGANNARDAMIALGGELANQVVTNYDTFPFVSGSFKSDPGATGAPNDISYFAGTAIVYNETSVVLQARMLGAATGDVFVREKNVSTWGPWITVASPNDKVNRAGDTMTGSLTSAGNVTAANLVATNAVYINGILHATQTGGYSVLYDGDARPNIYLGNNAVNNVNYYRNSIHQFQAVAGGATWFSINGVANMTTCSTHFECAGNANITGAVTAQNLTSRSGSITLGQYAFGLNVSDGFAYHYSGQAETYGLRLGGSAQGYKNYSRCEIFTFENVAGAMYARTQAAFTEIFAPFHINNQGFKPGGGTWGDNSDARIKNVIGDYEGGLDQVLALTPRRYTFKGNDTLEPPANSRSTPLPGEPVSKSTPAVPYANSGHYEAAVAGREFIGLVAQEAETVMPELVTQSTGYIDGTEVQDVRQVDTTALIFALVNCCKELAARVEALESVNSPG